MDTYKCYTRSLLISPLVLSETVNKSRKKMAVVWVVVPCRLVEVYQHFRGARYLWNTGELLPDHTVLQCGRLPSWHVLPWEQQILLWVQRHSTPEYMFFLIVIFPLLIICFVNLFMYCRYHKKYFHFLNLLNISRSGGRMYVERSTFVQHTHSFMGYCIWYPVRWFFIGYFLSCICSKLMW
jgi:hypothetical protein